jgi:cytosine/creatinine deaminase
VKSVAYDLLVRNARLRGDEGRLVDVGIHQGVVAALGEALTGTAEHQIDARGGLTTPAFANPHLHLCKVYTLERMDQAALREYHGAGMGKAMTAIELARRVKDDYDASWIIVNVRRALAEAAAHGNTHIRAFADVDSKARLEGVKALLQARQEFQGVVTLQVVAFAQDGLIREPEAAGLLRQAMEMGADVVGGIPWIEYTQADIEAHIRLVFDLAVEYDADVSMLVDDAGDPGLRSLEMVAVEAIRRGWQGRALAHHARAMALYPQPYLQKLAALLRQADLGLVTDPHTGPLHARVRELLEEGVLVCLGQDDISDAYYPFGRNNMLEVAFLAAHLLWMTTTEDLNKLYDMITTQAFRAMGLPGMELRTGSPADLVILQASSILEALRTHAAPQHVISHGRLVEASQLEALREGRAPSGKG